MLENRLLPRPIEFEPPGVSGSGFGGARKRWKLAKFVTAGVAARAAASRVAALTAASVFCTSFGTVANWHEGVWSRSLWNSSLVIPISTL